MKRTALVVSLLTVTLVAVVGFAIVKSQQDHKEKKSDQLSIVASTNVYGDLAKTVAGNKAEVSSVINKQSVSPEDYEPTNAVAKQVSNADIAFGNGLGYDSWLKKLAKTSKSTDTLLVGDDILHQKDGANPHLWNNPDYMIQAAQGLAKELGKRDPDNKAYYEANAKRYADKLAPVQEKIAAVKAQAAGKAVFQTEPVLAYLLEKLDMQIVGDDFAEAIEEGNDPSPAVLSDIEGKIKGHELKLFVQNVQTTGGPAKKLAKLAQENQIPIVKISETAPDHTSYVDWKLSELNAIQKALQ
ncbi:zinc ABC transporter substrate-binding protein [Leuconostocaceae bacterium ESL0958]|nr:zinc ABC transporter substrate-binding protein [Leuconostocaceae bacterium ESL0958]